MDAAERKLSRLRLWFVAYFAAELLMGAVAAAAVIEQLRASARYGPALSGNLTGVVVTFSLIAGAAILALALWAFHDLLRRKRWARLVLLVGAWLSAVDAATSLLGTASLGAWRGLLPGVDLGMLAGISLASNSLELLFWGYAILVLQFDRDVRAAFSERPASPAPAVR